MAAQSGSKKVIYAALAGNFLIAATKFVAAWFTGKPQRAGTWQRQAAKVLGGE